MADFENQDGESHRQGLREALMSAVELHREDSNDGENTAAASTKTAPAETGEAAAAAQRARDEIGRFAKPATAQPIPAPAGTPAVATTGENTGNNNPAIPASNPPSSWKKDYHESFAKLDPTLQKYILQRETEFNTGVSTYRAEAERAKSLHSALEPFMPNMQRYNVDPANWISTVGRVHETLLAGSPQQKLQTIMGLARDYGVDLSPLSAQQAQTENGQPAQGGDPLNPEVAWMREQIQQLSGQVNSFTQAQQKAQQDTLLQQQTAIQTEIQQFSADAQKYPHFEALRETMAGLLQSGLAQDLSSAYDKALRMNDDLWQAQQAQQTAQAEAERKRTAAAAAANARSKVVSVKSATPSSAAVTTSTAKDRRSQLTEAMASVNGGRV